MGLALLAAIPAIERTLIVVTVDHLAGVLRILGGTPVVAGSVIRAGNASVEIVPDCTPAMPWISLGAAILAFPSSSGLRVAGLLVGAALLWPLNLARVLALIVVLDRWPAIFQPVHAYLWQPVTLAGVLAIFLFWLRVARRCDT